MTQGTQEETLESESRGQILAGKEPPPLSPSTAHTPTLAPNFNLNWAERWKKRFSGSLLWVCMARVYPRTRYLIVRSSRVSRESVYVHLGVLMSVSVSVFVSISVSLPPEPSSIADFLKLSLTASLCLSPSVRLCWRLSSFLVPLLSPFFS